MTQKEIAIKCLETLDIYKPYIKKFKSKAGIPCFFENFAGFYADQEDFLYNKIKEVETKNDCLIYAITHEITEMGELWSMLCVPKECEDVGECLSEHSSNSYYAFAYVWNKADDWCSEFGDVVVRSAFGGIKRLY